MVGTQSNNKCNNKYGTRYVYTFAWRFINSHQVQEELLEKQNGENPNENST